MALTTRVSITVDSQHASVVRRAVAANEGVANLSTAVAGPMTTIEFDIDDPERPLSGLSIASLVAAEVKIIRRRAL